MTRQDLDHGPPQQGWRFYTGLALFVLGLMCPVFVALIMTTDLSVKAKAFASGALSIGIPEVLWILAAAVMGKEGFAKLKQKIWGLVKKAAPPDQVSSSRHALGLAMFSAVLVFAWLSPYLGHLLPAYDSHPYIFGVVGDFVFLGSLFVLGGDFWAKLRALFVRKAKVTSVP